jgi:chromosome segregation ATPase
MGLFNKAPKTASEVMNLIKGLPEEEVEKLLELFLADEDEDGKPDVSEEIEKAEDNIEEKGEDSQTEKDRVDESVAEQDKEDGNEDTQDAKDRVDEAEGEDKAIEEEAEETTEEIEPTEETTEETPVEDNKYEEVIQSLTARIEELEERLANVVEQLDGADFGNHKAEITESDNDADSEDTRIMKAYMGKQVYRK